MEPACSLSCTVITVLLIILACLCLGLFAGVLWLYPTFGLDTVPVFEDLFGTPTPTPVVVRPAPSVTPLAAALTPTGVPAQTPANTPAATPSAALTATAEPPEMGGVQETYVSPESLLTLEQAFVPTRDLRELAFQFKGLDSIPLTLEPPAAPLQPGDKKVFWAANTDTNETFMVSASLAYVTEHLYFWIEDGVRYSQEDLRDLAESFERNIYPTNRAFFGSESSPGVDGDPHLYILYAGGLGSRVAGYFSASDSYHPLAHPYSNGHEMFFLNSDIYRLNYPEMYGTLAHEFQHMIHWNIDRNEESWLNEGFSELASFLNGFSPGGFDRSFAANPDLQLNDWPNLPGGVGPHYGASFLFVAYFLDRYGEEMTRALVAETENGLESIDLVLSMNGTDASDGSSPDAELLAASQGIRPADTFFSEWTVANFLHDPEVADGRYSYSIYPDAPAAGLTEEVRRCPISPQTRTVRQYGTDYISILCPGEFTLRFEGSVEVGVTPAGPYSGDYAFWSNRGDESVMTLTRSFDFREHSGPLTFSYWTWYDIEVDYDYLYLLASTDGERWEFLNVPSGTESNPTGNSYGRAYNGLSGDGPRWIQEQVDISRFAGQEVQLRFKYVTDTAVNGEGFWLDDVSVPETGYFSNFELDGGGWEEAGFVRIQNTLPQTYRLSVITRGSITEVEHIIPGPDQSAVIPIRIGEGVDEIVLVVSGTARYTRQPAAYRFFIEP